jgi:hypothetical protein
MSDRTRGLYKRWKVTRLSDPTGKHDHCETFVLDLAHDRYSIQALTAYADACQGDYPDLAEDLRKRIVEMAKKVRA